jgi:RNA ligase (TIGR02306 family)
MSTRKMATIRKIDAINPIPDADAIEVATVGGWRVVVKRGEFQVNDLAVYVEIDAWVPSAVAAFLTKPGHNPKVYEGVEGERLRTVKLRKQLSQGLLLPVTQFDDTRCMLPQVQVELGDFTFGPKMVYLDDDVSEILGIVKYEPPVPAQLAGLVKGNFPSQIPKTDQERVQNLTKEIAAAQNLKFEVTEKLEGSSMTCYLIDGVFGVCSRNLDLKRDEANSFWKTAIDLDIEGKMRAEGKDNFAVQGELVGNGVQGNVYKMGGLDFYVYDVYDIQAGDYLRPAYRRALIGRMGLNHVPVIHPECQLIWGGAEGMLKFADGKSILNPQQDREGIVFKQVDGGMSMKAISNAYLYKHQD